MLVYFIKFSACLALLMVFYRFCLEKENMHVFKRFYLLFALGISFIIPLITFTAYISAIPDTELILSSSNSLNDLTGNASNGIWSRLLGVIYSIGVFVFGIKFIYNLSTIYKRIIVNPKLKSSAFINVLLKDLKVPHTFFNYIFLNQKQFEAQEIPTAVLLHEQAHAKQKHSIDIILIEILLIIFWFHPLIHILKKSVKLNHEFLADQAVLNHGVESTVYQKLLLTFSFHLQEPQLANAINYSSIKKRFTIMKTRTSKSSIWLRTLVVLPLIAIMLYGFSDTKTLLIESEIEVTQKEATKAQVLEYNGLAKHYSSQPEDQIIYKKKDLERMKYLYHLMSKNQRKQAEDFPVVLPPPPKSPKSPKKVPTVLEIKVKHPTAPKTLKQIKAPSSPKPTNIKVIQPKAPKTIEPIDAPSPPKPPLDHVIEMSKKGAIFYYEGKKISSDEAITLLKKNKKINISSRNSDSKHPVVHLSTKPFIVEIEVKN